jgi:hypothetical protein
MTLEEMTAKSTAIVRAKAISSSTEFLGSTIYTRPSSSDWSSGFAAQ